MHTLLGDQVAECVGPANLKGCATQPCLFTIRKVHDIVGALACLSPLAVHLQQHLGPVLGIGGFKEIIFEVRGEGAYSRLKYESGVHRVQRVPKTETQGRIHTSAATVAVLPEAEEVDVTIGEDDLRVDIFHASGHGGQNVQKVASAVRLTHIPTGIVVSCQNERSQHQNREYAVRILKARLLARQEEEKAKQVAGLRGQRKAAEWGSQIRSYVLHPYKSVKDHRTNLQSTNPDAVLGGDIDKFIEAYLMSKVGE